MSSTPSITFFCCYLFVVPLLVGVLFSRYAGVHSSHLLFFVIIWRGKAKWFLRQQEYIFSMVFKVQTHREETGDPLDMYRVNYDISHH